MTFREDCADVHEELACDPRMGERDHAIVHANLSKQIGILLLEGSPTAGEVAQNSLELHAPQTTKRMGPPNERKSFRYFDRAHRSETDDMLGHHVIGLVENLDRIEGPLPN